MEERVVKAKKEAWFKTHDQFREYLNISEIYSKLRQHLTDDQANTLRFTSVTNQTKVDSIMDWTPGKGGSWFEDFVDILDKTKNGTGHAEIICALQRNLDEECDRNGIPRITVAGKSK